MLVTALTASLESRTAFVRERAISALAAQASYPAESSQVTATSSVSPPPREIAPPVGVAST